MQTDQDLILRDYITGASENFFDLSVQARLKRVFHLHRFYYGESLPFLHFISRFDLYFDNLTRHRTFDFELRDLSTAGIFSFQ